MNQRIAKKIRSIIPPTDKISKRNYRRAKKKYTRLSAAAKPIIIEKLHEILSGL